MKSIIELRQLGMHYDTATSRIQVLSEINLTVLAGERIAVVGPSGSGKTTLLLLLAGLEQPTQGSVILDGVPLAGLDSDGLADLRRDRLGIVFQSFHLIPSLSALDNVAIPLEIAGQPNIQARARA
jgi:putative ABC transport system ATP-binding protein